MRYDSNPFSLPFIIAGIGILIALIIGFGTISVFRIFKKPATGQSQVKSNLIRVTNPLSNQIIQSPLIVEGEARGSWFFEASFPVKLVDANGDSIAQSSAQAKSDWMTENFVPFRAEIQFTRPVTGTGVLIFEKDNPSGLPENADALRIPVRF